MFQIWNNVQNTFFYILSPSVVKIENRDNFPDLVMRIFYQQQKEKNLFLMWSFGHVFQPQKKEVTSIKV